MLCGDDSDVTQEAEESCNYFAVRESNEFSLDGITWYKEGDYVYDASDDESSTRSLIRTIYDNGSILLENENDTLLCNAADMKISKAALGKIVKFEQDTIYAIRCRKHFSIDFINWFAVDQHCTIITNTEHYVDAVIRNITDDGKILITSNEQADIIDYMDIKSIQDFYENIDYLIYNEKKPIAIIETTVKFG